MISTTISGHAMIVLGFSCRNRASGFSLCRLLVDPIGSFAEGARYEIFEESIEDKHELGQRLKI